jgi:hypothetical protein
LDQEDIDDRLLLNETEKQLILIDSCRTYVRPGIAGISDGPVEFDHKGNWEAARKIYDNYILQSAKGKIIIHSTHEGAEARDDYNGTGGAFTNRLLRLATKYKGTNLFAPGYIKTMLPVIEKALYQDNFPQSPEMVYEEGNLGIPFFLYIPQNEPTISARIAQPVYVEPTPNYPWLKLAGIGLIVFGLIQGSKE